VIVFVSIITTLGNLLVPGGALVAMAIAFQMTGLPLEGIAILAGVDWFAGMARTLLNVVGDVLVTTFIAISENEFDRAIFDANQVDNEPVLKELVKRQHSLEAK
jgi:Na+/H+-dicarboxylate symporter